MELFQINKLYSRNKDIHPKLGGLANHGSTQRSTMYPIVMLFSDWSGKQGWYRDDWSTDHTYFSFAGSQQTSKMNIIVNHINRKESLYLFLCSDNSKMFKFLGEFVYLRTRITESNTGQSDHKDILVYDLLPTFSPAITSDPTELDIRTKAFRGKQWSAPPLGQIKPEPVATAASTSWKRDPATRAFVLDRSNGVCEHCGQPAPFRTSEGSLYLEVHHVVPLSKGGSDTWSNSVALCPNCHRKLHYGDSAQMDSSALLEFLNGLRRHASQNA